MRTYRCCRRPSQNSSWVAERRTHPLDALHGHLHRLLEQCILPLLGVCGCSLPVGCRRRADQQHARFARRGGDSRRPQRVAGQAHERHVGAHGQWGQRVRLPAAEQDAHCRPQQVRHVVNGTLLSDSSPPPHRLRQRKPGRVVPVAVPDEGAREASIGAVTHHARLAILLHLWRSPEHSTPPRRAGVFVQVAHPVVHSQRGHLRRHHRAQHVRPIHQDARCRAALADEARQLCNGQCEGGVARHGVKDC